VVLISIKLAFFASKINNMNLNYILIPGPNSR